MAVLVFYNIHPSIYLSIYLHIHIHTYIHTYLHTYTCIRSLIGAARPANLRRPAHEPNVRTAELHEPWRLHGPGPVRAAGIPWADGHARTARVSRAARHARPAGHAAARHAASVQLPHHGPMLYGDRRHHPGLLPDPDDARLPLAVAVDSDAGEQSSRLMPGFHVTPRPGLVGCEWRLLEMTCVRACNLIIRPAASLPSRRGTAPLNRACLRASSKQARKQERNKTAK